MTAPFWPLPVGFRGAAPSWQPPEQEQRSRRLWLGDPTSTYGMIELPGPSKSTPPTTARSRGKVMHGLYGGGTSVISFPSATRTWTYTWSALTERGWQLLAGFDDNAFHDDPLDASPWVLVDVEGVNRLTVARSMCTGAGWVPSAGTVTAAAGVAPHTTPSRVMQWVAASGNRLVGGSIVGGVDTPDARLGAVNLPGEPVIFSFYAWVASGTGVISARLTGANADGSGAVPVSGSAVTVGTTPTAVYVAVPPGAFGTVPYLLTSMVAGSSSTFLISNPQLSYTSSSMPWGRGAGCPRVIITSELDRSLSHGLYSLGPSLTLAEAYPGSA